MHLGSVLRGSRQGLGVKSKQGLPCCQRGTTRHPPSPVTWHAKRLVDDELGVLRGALVPAGSTQGQAGYENISDLTQIILRTMHPAPGSIAMLLLCRARTPRSWSPPVVSLGEQVVEESDEVKAAAGD
jgi:hypothetical protein